MKQRPSIKEWLFITAVAVVCGVMIGWFARAIYDKLFFLEGTILVVNCTDQTLDITLDFPSGTSKQMTLNPKASHEYVETNTGEGDISVSIPGRTPENVGYVTTMNDIIVLSIDDNNTTFSQILP